MPPASSGLSHGAALRWVGALIVVYLALTVPLAGIGIQIPHYLTLHTTLEAAAIIVSMLGFGIAWNAHAEARPGNTVLIGAVLFGSGLLDYAHALSYHGMPEFVTPSSPQKAIVFWLAARALTAVGLLAIALRPWQEQIRLGGRSVLLGAICVYVAAVYVAELYFPQAVPDFFVIGKGLTPLKIGIEYLLVTLYALAALLFLRHGRRGATFNANALLVAAVAAVLSELAFTLYLSVTDIFNALGHVFKIVCYAFIYRAIFVESVHQPFAELSDTLERERAWSAEQHSFVRTFDMLEEAVVEIAPDGRILRANRGWWRLIGMDPTHEFRLADSIHADDREALAMRLAELLDGKKDEFRGRFRALATGRDERWMECRFVTERTDQGKLQRIRGILRDITKSYQQERHITHMALHDALTNLPNRVLLEDRTKTALLQAGRNQTQVALAFIDVDHFKNINDSYGHKTGDALLLTLAGELKSVLREGDTLARWGGDEFVVLLPDANGIEAVRLVAEKLMGAMQRSFEIDGLTVSSTFSMGVALFPDDGHEVDELLAKADRAMFHAKASGRNNCQFFAEMAGKGFGKQELYIQARLAEAIRERRIDVAFQPQVLADGRLPGRIVGVEALARWTDADNGPIPPGTFIPMAENLGLIGELGDQVRAKALAAFAPWRMRYPDLQLSLNVSKRQLFSSEFLNRLQWDVQMQQLQPAAIVLEITESVAMMEVDVAETRLQELADAGFTLSIDDFGTGYASLSQLHELPVDELKIDISFVRRLTAPEGVRMVQAIVSMAQALRLRTVAEGVEDEGAARLLADLGVTLLQGYYFGRPCSAEAMAELLASASPSPAAAPDR